MLITETPLAGGSAAGVAALPEQADCWTIPAHGRMRAAAQVFGSAATREEVRTGSVLTQLLNMAALPGVVGPVTALPEVQPGYGFPIGAVAAFDARAGGVVVPGGIGYDVNCGVRLLRSTIPAEELRPRLGALLDDLVRCALFSPRRLATPELYSVLAHGAGWAVAHGCGIPADIDPLAWRGAMPQADPGRVPPRALLRGAAQLGTLGSGSHFIEIGCVERVYDHAAADALCLAEGLVTVLIHSGSRGVGSEVCAEAVELMLHAAERYRIQLPDRQLACAPLASEEGRQFLGAMAAAANYAFANRQVLTHRVREAVARALALPASALGLSVACDLPHNLATIETHTVGGKEVSLCVHRRCAAHALPPGHPALSGGRSAPGQPVVLPGDMGRYSLLVLPGPAVTRTFHSLPHGAGRCLGRSAARSRCRGRDCAQELAAAGIEVRSASPDTLEECCPEAYHGLDDMVAVLERTGLARPVARLRPMGVLRG